MHHQRRWTPASIVVHPPQPTPMCAGHPHQERCCVSTPPGTNASPASFTPTRLRLQRLTAAPEPFALLLDDGTQCRLRNGGAWGGRDDNYWGAYGCPGENPAILVPAQSAAPAVDRSHPLWTVKVGPLGSTDEHFPPPETHTVTTAWFAGN